MTRHAPLRKFGACILFLFLSAQPASPKSKAAPGGLALGLILGSPTGISAKYWVRRARAADAALGFPFADDGKFSFHTDYLFLFPIEAQTPGKLSFYAGAGARLRSIDRPRESAKVDFGLRIPMGAAYEPKSIPFEFFAEVVPVIVFVPKGAFHFDGGIGARYKLP